jgi:hypothetical protein
VDPNAHTNIPKRKIEFFLINFQLSVIDISGLPGSCRALERIQQAVALAIFLAASCRDVY